MYNASIKDTTPKFLHIIFDAAEITKVAIQFTNGLYRNSVVYN
ncbi:protein of unknown function [Moritella yayanosii]|uniref:Uncharacterized protein n=1 Tax=Moritella yayanosii TaxID=69539 RepID=A0A330LUK7_9GAMM|nr:protein of unknown function [Moritella yayanosii]